MLKEKDVLTSKLAILCRRDDFSADIRSTSWLTCHKRQIPARHNAPDHINSINFNMTASWVHMILNPYLCTPLTSQVSLMPRSHLSWEKGPKDFLTVLSQQYWIEETLIACLDDRGPTHWLKCMLGWCGTISLACPKSRLLTQHSPKIAQ